MRRGPKSETVARIGMPGPMPPIDRYSVGKPVGAYGMPSSASRLAPGPSGSPGAATPDTSPFTSATKTGTPCAESCSAMSCSVFVLPVPVAPAMSPWRVIMRRATCTLASGNMVPSWTPRPRSTEGPSTA